MTSNVINMAEAAFTYIIGLNCDDGMLGRFPKYARANSMLKDFLTAHKGQYIGEYIDHGTPHPEYAVVKMTPASEEALQDLNWELHINPDDQPFVGRLEGAFFDIYRGDKIHFCTDRMDHNPRPEITC